MLKALFADHSLGTPDLNKPIHLFCGIPTKNMKPLIFWGMYLVQIFMSSKFMRLCHLMYIITYGWPYQLFVITFIYNVVNSKNVQRLLIYCLLSFSVEIFLWGDEFFPVGLWIIWEVIKILLETFTTVNDEFWYFLSCKNPQREGECYF